MTGDDLVLDEPCPLCKAEAGHPCHTFTEPYRTLAWSHVERIRAYYRLLDGFR